MLQQFLGGNAGGGMVESSNQKVVTDVTNLFKRIGYFTLDISSVEKAIFLPEYKDSTIYNVINSLKTFLR